MVPPAAPRTLAEWSLAWLDHLEVERGVSPHTHAAYRRDFDAVLSMLRIPPSELTASNAVPSPVRYAVT